MKALSVGLVKGSIDEVDKRVHMTWVQPRVLDLQQVPNVRAERAPSAGGDPRAVRGHGGNCSPSCCLETPRERGSGSAFLQPLPWGCAALGVCVLQWGVGDPADGAGIGDTSHPRATQTPETQPLGCLFRRRTAAVRLSGLNTCSKILVFQGCGWFVLW